jgi:nucleoside-diphosphate-sugar epimerase
MQDFRGKNVLITGGAGFIGSALARRLVSAGAKVTLVDSMIPEYGGNLFNIHDIKDQLEFNICDVRDTYAMGYLVKGKDYLFNLAGQTSHIDSMHNPIDDLEINAKAQLSTLEACREHNGDVRIVFASTRQIYGRPQYLPVDEDHPIIPVDVNGINKTSGEWFHLLYQDVYNIPTSVLRLTNTYGPGMRIVDARQTFVGIWIRLLLEQQPFKIWGGSQKRDFNYVDDVVDAFLLSATNEDAIGQVFNLGSSEVVTLLELAECLAGFGDSGYEVEEFPEDRKKIDIGDYYSDFSRIKETLDWTPKVNLETGMQRTVSYYQSNIKHYT